MSDQQACQVDPNWREPLRWRLARLYHRLAWPIYLHVYCRHIYRHHMRLLHHFGKHWWKHYGPMIPDGRRFDKCDWCGAFRDGQTPASPDEKENG